MRSDGVTNGPRHVCGGWTRLTASASTDDGRQLDPHSQVSDTCTSYAELDRLNEQLHPALRELTNNTDYFSHYRLNLYHKQCPFWTGDGVCGNIACAVTTLDDEADIPAAWRAEELSKLQGPHAAHPGRQQRSERSSRRPLLGELGDAVGESCVVDLDDDCDDRDYCVPDDEALPASGDYVSLADNPERFTGYAGEGARRVWEAIYRENCFARPRAAPSDDDAPPWPPRSQAMQDLAHVLRARDPPSGAADFDGACLEKRVFYRIISGMHASVSTHLCFEHLDQHTGRWGPDTACYRARLHRHPDRIANLYFAYALVLRAVALLHDLHPGAAAAGAAAAFLPATTFCAADPARDARTRALLARVARAVPRDPRAVFDERALFRHDDALKADFRARFRNVSRVMDCVGCDKCRLWGKLQTQGYGVALKLLLEREGEGELVPLRRTELVALVNLLDKLGAALHALARFRTLLAAETAPSAPRPPSLADLDDFPSPPPRRRRSSLATEFGAELARFRTALTWVLRRWLRLPATLGGVVHWEVRRLADVWLGRPVRGRGWGWTWVGTEGMGGEL